MEKIIKKEINVMNVLLCLIVVFIHITSEAVSTLRVDSLQFLTVYIPHKLFSFVVYGFIFISAIKLFIKDINHINLLEYYKSRLKKIVIPYLVSVLIFYIYFIKKGYFEFSILDFIKYALTGDLVAHFYFVIIIVQFYFLFPIWKKIIEKVKPFVGIIISLLITLCFTKYLPIWLSNMFENYNFIYNDRIFTTYLFYWICGAYVGHNYQVFCQVLKKRKVELSLLFLAISLLYLLINYSFVIHKNFIEYLNILQIIYSLIAILFVYLLCLKFSNNDKIYYLIEPINKSSYAIYLYHVLIIFMLNEILNRYSIIDMAQRLPIKIIVVYLVLIGYCFLKDFIIKWKRKAKI